MTHDDYDMPCSTLSQLWTPFHLWSLWPINPPFLPPYFYARVNLLWTQTRLALSFLSSCPFWRCALWRALMPPLSNVSLVHLPLVGGYGTSEKQLFTWLSFFFLIDRTSAIFILNPFLSGLIFFPGLSAGLLSVPLKSGYSFFVFPCFRCFVFLFFFSLFSSWHDCDLLMHYNDDCLFFFAVV